MGWPYEDAGSMGSSAQSKQAAVGHPRRDARATVCCSQGTCSRLNHVGRLPVEPRNYENQNAYRFKTISINKKRINRILSNNNFKNSR